MACVKHFKHLLTHGWGHSSSWLGCQGTWLCWRYRGIGCTQKCRGRPCIGWGDIVHNVAPALIMVIHVVGVYSSFVYMFELAYIDAPITNLFHLSCILAINLQNCNGLPLLLLGPTKPLFAPSPSTGDIPLNLHTLLGTFECDGNVPLVELWICLPFLVALGTLGATP